MSNKLNKIWLKELNPLILKDERLNWYKITYLTLIFLKLVIYLYKVFI